LRQFGQYEILAKVGQGGMGAVYKARQEGLDRIVALKVMNPHVASPQSYARFDREVKVLSLLRHPNIVRLFTTGRHRNRVYFTMDYIEGESLAELVQRAQTHEDRGVLVNHLVKVARAIDYAHGKGIVHRDLKPSNIIVDSHGEPIVTDFGLAKELGAQVTVTVSGEAVGTVQYMSPEQARGDREAIGPAIRRGIDRHLQTICLKCLEREPGDRYESAKALADDLERYRAGEPILARRPRLAGRLTRRIRERPWTAAAIGASVVVVLVAAALVCGRAAGPPPAAGRPDESLLPATAMGPPATQQSLPHQLSPAIPTSMSEEEGPSQESGKLRAVLAPEETAVPGPEEERTTVVALFAGAKAPVTSYYTNYEITAIAASADEVWWGTTAAVFSLDAHSGGWRIFYDVGKPVSAITQDQDGLWWFGTHGSGVFSFDGRTWRRYTTADGLADDDVQDIGVDPDGRKWFSSKRAVSSFDGKRWETYEAPTGVYRSTTQPVVTIRLELGPMAVDQEGRKWFPVDHWMEAEDAPVGGRFANRHQTDLWCLDGGTWTSHSLSQEESNFVDDIVIDEAGRKWVATFLGVLCWDGQVREVPADVRQWEPRSAELAADRDGRIWVCAPLVGACCLDGMKWERYQWLSGRWLAPTAVAAAPDGRVWVASAGVYCFDGSEWTLHTGQSGLPHSHVLAIAVDLEGRKWFALQGGGCCLEGQTWHNWVPPSIRGIRLDHVRAVRVDREGQLWFASNCNFRIGGGRVATLCSFNGESWQAYTEHEPLGDNPAYAMDIDRDGGKWLVTSKGLISFDGRTCEQWPLPTAVAPADVSTIRIDIEGRRWLGTRLGAYCSEGDEWRAYDQSNGLAHNEVLAIEMNLDGRIWFGTRGGVSCFDGQAWMTYTSSDGLADDSVTAIAFDPAGRAWFGTNGGVSCFDGGTWRSWTTRESLAGNEVTSLAVDLDGSIWVGTPCGLSHINPTEAD